MGPLRSRQPLRTAFFDVDVKQQIFQRYGPLGDSAICRLLCWSERQEEVKDPAPCGASCTQEGRARI